MQRTVLGGVIVAFVMSSCSGQEATAPTFQVTSPSLATTSTTTPDSLQYLGVPELSDEENAMCTFVDGVGRDLEASDRNSQNTRAAVERSYDDRTLSEPLRVRSHRNAELANAQRFANVLRRFTEGAELIEQIEPGEHTSAERLSSDAADIALLIEIGNGIDQTVAALQPLDAAAQAAYLAEHQEEWADIRTTADLDRVLLALNNESIGMGRETEARDAMERVDDWSWRHCSSGLTR